MSKENTKLQTWRVIDKLGNIELIDAHFMFQDKDTGALTFRFKTPTQSYVPAAFGAGQWVSCVLQTIPKADEAPIAPTAPKADARRSRRPRETEDYRRPLSYASPDDEIPF
jgi:hypothetical protein